MLTQSRLLLFAVCLLSGPLARAEVGGVQDQEDASPVRAAGGIFFQTKDQVLTVILPQSQGQPQKVRTQQKLPILISGGNFFVTAQGLTTIGQTGVSSFKPGMSDSQLVAVGLNYLVNEKDEITTINSAGKVVANHQKLSRRIAVSGGNYYESPDGVITTISSEGVVQAQTGPGTRIVGGGLGGNFFITSEGVRTVNQDGKLSAQPWTRSGAEVLWAGGSFFQLAEGLFWVSPSGEIIKTKLDLKSPVLKRGSIFLESREGLYTFGSAGQVFGPELLADPTASAAPATPTEPEQVPVVVGD